MQYICHRINHAVELAKIPSEYGVELDLRDGLDGKVYIEHNPFTPGEDFQEYLKLYHHGTMILNIKSERIEEKVLDLISEAGVKKYFFLDSSFPMIVLLADRGVRDVAIRLSEYEGIDTIRNMAAKVRWVWVDCFTKCPVTKKDYEELKSLGFDVCFVSPELQGRSEAIEEYASYLKENNIIPDAICTKHYNISRWKQALLEE